MIKSRLMEKKILILNLISSILIILTTILPVKALTVWKYEDWQDGKDYGLKNKVSSNITNLKGEKVEKGGMKVGPYNKASKAKLSDNIVEELYVGLNLDNYQNSELFELSIALNQKKDNEDAKYLTEAVVMTQKSGDKFILTANWANNKNPIATIDTNGIYTYKWEFKKDNDNKIKVKFTVLDYGKEIGTTDFVELKVENSDKATDVRYLWACNIKANYGIDIYTTLPPKNQDNLVENPDTLDINLYLLIGLIITSSLGLRYSFKKKY